MPVNSSFYRQLFVLQVKQKLITTGEVHSDPNRTILLAHRPVSHQHFCLGHEKLLETDTAISEVIARTCKNSDPQEQVDHITIYILSTLICLPKSCLASKTADPKKVNLSWGGVHHESCILNKKEKGKQFLLIENRFLYIHINYRLNIHWRSISLKNVKCLACLGYPCIFSQSCLLPLTSPILQS